MGLGTSATTVLRTSFYANVTSANTGVFTGYLKPGSAFDPTGDIANIQPQMYDQFAAMYNRYKVNSFTVRIKIIGTAANSAAAQFPVSWNCAAYPAVDNSVLATYQAAASQQYAKTTSGVFNLIGNNVPTVYGIGAEGKYLSFKMKHSSVLGDRVDPYDNGALVTVDPSALQYAVLPIFLQAGNPSTAQWNLEIDIFQNVTFSQKKNTVDA